MKFEEIFKEITPEELPCDVFALGSKIFPVVTVTKRGIQKASDVFGE